MARKVTGRLLLGMLSLIGASDLSAEDRNGKALYAQRCAICHGADLKGTGPLARKSSPPAPDLTTSAVRRKLASFPDAIPSSIVLRPNGTLIPDTLRRNGVSLPKHSWSTKELRDIDRYMKGRIAAAR